MQGIHTALVTPFEEGGAVSWQAYEALCERQLDGGVHGLVACGTTAETPTLERQEWAELIRTTVRVSAGRVPVTAGVGTNDTRSTLHNLEMAGDLGAQAGLLVFPYYNKPSADGLRAHVRAAGEVGLPLVLYHVPGRTGQRLSAALLAELCELPGVIGIKEATGDIGLGLELCARTDKAVLSGDDFTFTGLYAVGGKGCISVLSNVLPAETVRVHEDMMAGRLGAAASRMQALWPVIRYLFDESNPIPVKALLSAMGLCGRELRLPLMADARPVPEDILSRCMALSS